MRGSLGLEPIVSIPRSPAQRRVAAPQKNRQQILRLQRKPTSGLILPRLLLGGLAIYALCLGAFTLLQYDEENPRPGGGELIRDFHAYLGFGPRSAKAEAETEAEEPEMPLLLVKQAPPTRKAVAREPSPLDRVYRTLKDVEREAPALTKMGRGPRFDETRIDLLSRLSEAREVLGRILDEDPGHDRANGLWDDLQYLQAALRKY